METNCLEMMKTLMAKPKIYHKLLVNQNDLIKLFQILLFHMSEDKQMQIYELKDVCKMFVVPLLRGGINFEKMN